VGDPEVQGPSRRGLSTFLADHEDCGKGFDIQRREGSDGSIVRVICGGCGAAIEYPAAGGVELPADQPVSRSVSERLLNRDRRTPAPSAAAAATPRAPAAKLPAPAAPAPNRSPRAQGKTGPQPPASRRPASRPLGWPSWLATVMIALLIGGGLALVVVGVTSNDGSSENEGSGSAPPTNSATPTAPAPAPPAPAATPSNPPAAAIKLDRRKFDDRVSIGIPPRWDAGVSDGAVTLAARNGDSQVQIYFEQGARDFLLERHSAGRVTGTGRTQAGGREARNVTVTYPGGTESAVILAAGGYTYVILERLGKPVSPALQRATNAVVASFRPA
jgi:hypothetical protein